MTGDRPVRGGPIAGEGGDAVTPALQAPRLRLEAPYRICRDSPARLRVADASLLGAPDLFARLDVYPLMTPSPGRRHYGFWDIPLAAVTTRETLLRWDGAKGVLSCGERRDARPIGRGWRGPLREAGYVKVHCSLWKGYGGSRAEMLETGSSVHLLLEPGGDLPPLKQLNIPLTDRCNLRCVMCPRQKSEGLVEADIGPEVLEPLLDACGDVVCVLLQGLGEPLLYPDLEGLVAAVKRRLPPGGEVGLTTNGTLLDRGKAEALVRSGVDFVYFSVDGASAGVYERVRPGARFERVARNIGACVEIAAAAGVGRPHFMMNLVVMRENVRELADYVLLASRLGVRHVTFSHCIGEEPPLADPADLESAYRQAEAAGARAGVVVDRPPSTPLAEERCLFMERVVLLGSGEVLPCHAMAPGYATAVRSRSFGSVRERSLGEIWSEVEFRQFRRRVLAGDFPPECSGCPCKAFLVP